MLMRTLLRILEYAALMLLLLLAVDAFISTGLTCYEIGKQPGSEQYPIDNCSILKGPIVAAFIWFANIFEKHKEVVIAAFTIVLAVSTIGLWRSTEKLWEAVERQIRVATDAANAAKKSADAAVAVELPMLLVTAIVLEPSSTRDDTSEYFPDVTSRICMSYENLGKTPAILTKISFVWKVIKEMPRKPLYTDIQLFETGHIVRPGDRQNYETGFNIDLTQDQIFAIRKNELSFWVYGFIEYRDFMGEEHNTGFCALWERGDRGRRQSSQFVEAGLPQYIYQS